MIWDNIRYPKQQKEENMSTRSNIAIEDPKTKKVKVIYVHSDGYPYGVGKCLVDNYLSLILISEPTRHLYIS